MAQIKPDILTHRVTRAIMKDGEADVKECYMCKLEKIDIIKLLVPMIRFPWVVSLVEEFYVDWLLDAGFLDPITLLVNAAGRDFVACNDSLMTTV